MSEHKPGQDILSKRKLVLTPVDFFVPGLSALVSCASLYPPVPLSSFEVSGFSCNLSSLKDIRDDFQVFRVLGVFCCCCFQLQFPFFFRFFFFQLFSCRVDKRVMISKLPTCKIRNLKSFRR